MRINWPVLGAWVACLVIGLGFWIGLIALIRWAWH
jgi:uncharacterized membrane protein